MINFNELRDQCHSAALRAGWWKKTTQSNLFPETIIIIDIKRVIANLAEPTPYMGQILALIHSEISEAMTGYIYSLSDEHLPHRISYEVELADTVIRIMDLFGALSVDTQKHITQFKYKYWPMPARITSTTEKLAFLHVYISKALACYRKNTIIDGQHGLIIYLSKTIIEIYSLAESLKIPLDEVIQEKLTYNATRADHKSKERNKPNGKKF